MRLYKEQFGRGPTQACAAWASDDILTVVLEDTYAPAERNLAKMGAHARLRDTRMWRGRRAVTPPTASSLGGRRGQPRPRTRRR